MAEGRGQGIYFQRVGAKFLNAHTQPAKVFHLTADEDKFPGTQFQSVRNQQSLRCRGGRGRAIPCLFKEHPFPRRAIVHQDEPLVAFKHNVFVRQHAQLTVRIGRRSGLNGSGNRRGRNGRGAGSQFQRRLRGDDQFRLPDGRCPFGFCRLRRWLRNDIPGWKGHGRRMDRFALSPAHHGAEHFRQGRLHRQSLAEADFTLGGVHVDIHIPRIHVHEKKGHRMLAARQSLAVGGSQRLGEMRIFNRTTIEEDQKKRAIRSRHSRLADVSAYRDPATGLLRHLQQALRQIIAREPANPFQQRSTAGQLEYQPVIMCERETHLGVGQRLHPQQLFDVAELRGFRAKKFASRRNIIEQIAHLNLRAGRSPPFLHADGLAALDHNLCAHHGSMLPCRQREPGDARNARHRLTTESQRANGRQIRTAAQLAGGMPLQTHDRILGIHPMTVVHHPDQGDSPAMNQNIDPPGPGIQGILHQLLYHRGRALHDLASRHLTGQYFRENLNSRHFV